MFRSLPLILFACAVFADGRPLPLEHQVKRIHDEVELYGIVHWGLNTYTDREWGFGDEDPLLLAPTSFDAGQIVRSAKAGGLQGLILVAKHHDGFCLWPTKTTEHNITKSPFRGGTGDYVREMSDACHRNGLKFGVYCSPWDRNNPGYGTERYVETFRAQIRELLDGRYGDIFEMWFDNANGGDGYYGGARETRKIPPDYYRFDEVFRFVREMQPSVCIFNEDDAADFRWPGNEKGVLGEECRATAAHFDISRYDDYMKWTAKGVMDGVRFHPPEADFPLRPGWFYHEGEKGRTKSAEYLMRRYLNIVGNGGSMNVGIAPDKRGVLCDEDVRALERFGELRRAFFSRPVTTGLCNVVIMREDVLHGERVDDWVLSANGEALVKGNSIGIKRIRVLTRLVEVQNLKLQVSGRTGVTPVVKPLQCYRADRELLDRIFSSCAESDETDTAKWMNAGRGAHPEMVVLSNRFGRVEVSTVGAQVISYRPMGRQEVLFMPDDRDFSRDREMHGGIPVCWPWFGRFGEPGTRMHGLARYCSWRVAGQTNSADVSRLVLTLDSSEETHKKWPHDFHLKYDVSLTDQLTLTLTAKNTGSDPLDATFGFHPYFRVRNPSDVTVHGLKEPLRAYPGIDGGHETESGGTYSFDAGDDRIELSAKGEKNLVVWNPGPDWKDWTPYCNLTTNDWRHFLCVEPAVIGVENARRIEPGESVVLQMMIYGKKQK